MEMTSMTGLLFVERDPAHNSGELDFLACMERSFQTVKEEAALVHQVAVATFQ